MDKIIQYISTQIYKTHKTQILHAYISAHTILHLFSSHSKNITMSQLEMGMKQKYSILSHCKLV